MDSIDDFKEFCLSKGAQEISYDTGRRWAVSENPLFSIGYSNCNGAGFLCGDSACGLTHYQDTTKGLTSYTGQPKDYLPRVLKRLMKFGNSLEAVLLAGDAGHQKNIKAFLTSENIQITEEFCDGWSNNIIGLEKGFDSYIGKKGILILPNNREVYIYSSVKEIGFRRLF